MYIFYYVYRAIYLDVYVCIILTAKVRAIRNDVAIVEGDRTTSDLLCNLLPVITPPI